MSKIFGRYYRDLTLDEIDKCKKDTLVFAKDGCIGNALDFLLKFKGERKVKNKIVEYNLQLHAYNVSGFDTWIILNNLPSDKRIVDFIKIGKGIISLRVFQGCINSGKKQIPEYLVFRCGMTPLIFSLKKLGKTFKLQEELLKTEMNDDKFDENNYMNNKDEWLPYVKNDVLCTAFTYARYTKAMEDITGFSMKDCLSLPGLGWKYLNSLRTEEDEPIYTDNDKYMRWFVRQSIKGGRVCAFKYYYISKNCDDILKIISEYLDVERNIYDFLEVYLKYLNKHFKIYENEYESKFNDYRDEKIEEKDNYINEKTSQLPIHQLIKQIKLDELLWDFDTVSLYPCAM